MRWSSRSVLSLTIMSWVISACPAVVAQERAGSPAPGQSRGVPRTGAVAPKSAAPKAAAAPFDPDGTKMQMLLIKWAKQSTQLRSLDVNIRRIDQSKKWGNEQYVGRALFQSPNLAWLDFKKVVTKDGKQEYVPHERIVCTGKEVWQYRSDTQQVYIHELDVQQRQRALQEGPLPFLFNFEAEAARKRYQLKLNGEDENSYTVIVVPLLDIDKESFRSAYIELDKTMLLPRTIVLLDPEGKSQKHFTMSDIKPNHPVAAANFKGVKPGPPWKVMYTNEEGGTPKAGAAPARTGAAPRQLPAGRAAATPGRNVR